MPMYTPKTGGMTDILNKGQKVYGIMQALYGAYQTGSQVYRVIRPFIQAPVPL